MENIKVFTENQILIVDWLNENNWEEVHEKIMEKHAVKSACSFYGTSNIVDGKYNHTQRSQFKKSVLELFYEEVTTKVNMSLEMAIMALMSGKTVVDEDGNVFDEICFRKRTSMSTWFVRTDMLKNKNFYIKEEEEV